MYSHRIDRNAMNHRVRDVVFRDFYILTTDAKYNKLTYLPSRAKQKDDALSRRQYLRHNGDVINW